MKLRQALVERGFAKDISEAKRLILQGVVFVDEKETTNEYLYVSGKEKIEVK